MRKKLDFPDNFFIGAATSAYQVEGNNTASDWWLLEQQPAVQPHMSPSGPAIDHYNRYEEDVALMAGLGLKGYRFSVEWARIEPEPGKFSQSAIDHYQRMLDAVLAHGMVPVVTLHHFTHPAWIALKGEPVLGDLPELFARYCEVVMTALGDRTPWVCTINEANIRDVMHLVLPSMGGLFSKDRKSFLMMALLDSFETTAAAHALACDAIRSQYSSVAVGWTLAASPVFPLDEEAAAVTEALTARLVDRYLDISRSDDFVGIQVYQRHIADAYGNLIPPGEDEEVDSHGKRFDPEALELVLNRTWTRCGVPQIVTESGICTDDDTQRIRYIDRALAGVSRALERGVDVRGYLHWSAFDNYEWGSYIPKYGLIEVDRQTMQRKAKPSARHLAGYC